MTCITAMVKLQLDRWLLAVRRYKKEIVYVYQCHPACELSWECS